MQDKFGAALQRDYPWAVLLPEKDSKGDDRVSCSHAGCAPQLVGRQPNLASNLTNSRLRAFSIPAPI